jgi:putative photosynthetic complex assembly protein 2
VVSWSGHILPVLVTVAIWFLATGLIAWLDNRQRATFPRSLMLGAGAGLVGLGAILAALHWVSVWAVYLGFAGALLVWSWHEIALLTGAAAGPRREDCPAGLTKWQRFSHASATLVYHEIALALTALMLISLSWAAPNQIGAMTFALLYVLRLSAKLNIFAGVPNAATDILPAHLAYLKTYYGPKRLGLGLLLSIAAISALSAWIGAQAIAAPEGGPEAVGASLLFALAALGALEHLFLALPFRDGALWGWALPNTRKAASPADRMITLEGES